MSRRHVGLSLGIAALLGATVAPPPAGAATTTTIVTRDGVNISVTHVDGSVPTTDKHPLSRFDIDGDGRDEIIVNGFAGSTSGPFTLAVYLTRTGAVERLTTGSTNLSGSVVADFDGDGFGDLAVTDDRGPGGSPQYAGGIWVFYGGLGGFALDRTGHFTQATAGIPGDPTEFARFGGGLTAADFDGDGRSDLVARGPLAIDTWLIILRGTASGVTATGARQITPAQLSPSPGAVAGFGLSAAAGDVTGDGRPDLVVGSGDGRLFLLRGSATGPLTTSPSVVKAVSASNLIVTYHGLDARAVADVNGDGFGDVIASNSGAVVNGNSSAGAVAVFYGNAQGISGQRRTLLHRHSIGVPGAPAETDFFGGSVSAGDVTGDGYADLVIGSDEAVGANAHAGVLYVFRGSAQGVRPQDNQVFTQDSPDVPGAVGAGISFGDTSLILDLDGTGPLDVLATAIYAHIVVAFYGGSSGLTAVGDLATEALMDGGAKWPMLLTDGAAASGAAGSVVSGGDVAGRTATAAGMRAAAEPATGPVRRSATGTLSTTVDSSAAAAPALVPVSTAARFDLDGDGKDEAVVSAMQLASVRYSRSGRVDRLVSPTANTYLASATAAGDFDHDGFTDLAIGDPLDDLDGTSMERTGGVWICRGSADGLLYDDCLHLTQNSPGVEGIADSETRFGWALAAGDLNGDGYADLAIGAPGESRPNPLYRRLASAPPRLVSTGSVTVLYGGSDGLRPTRGRRLVHQLSTANRLFGYALAAGDVTGDGLDDLAVGVPGMRGGSVELFTGKPSGLASTFTSRVAAPDIQGNGQLDLATALSIADTDADGREDVIVSAGGAIFNGQLTGAVVEFRGLATGISGAARRVLRPGSGGVPPVGQSNYFGDIIATGDANDDGYADLVVGIPFADPDNEPYPQPGMIVVLPGSAAGLTGTGSAKISGPAGAQFLGSSVSMLNADGTGGLEILAGAPGGDPSQSSKIGLYCEYQLSGSTLALLKTTTAADVVAPGWSVYSFGQFALHR